MQKGNIVKIGKKKEELYTCGTALEKNTGGV